MHCVELALESITSEHTRLKAMGIETEIKNCDLSPLQTHTNMDCSNKCNKVEHAYSLNIPLYQNVFLCSHYSFFSLFLSRIWFPSSFWNLYLVYVHNSKFFIMADKLTRIAIVNHDKCKPKKCRQECKKSCPVVRMGKELKKFYINSFVNM